MQRYGFHRKLGERYGLVGDAAWTLLTAAVLVSINAWLAIVVHTALLFASLGPIIYQLMDEPLDPASSPRSAILANGCAIAIGYGSLATFGLLGAPAVTASGVTVARAVAAACALGVTGFVIVVLRALHPPAGATTLLVSLGFIHEAIPCLIMFGGVVLVVVAGIVLNRLSGVPVPLWSPPRRTP